MRTGNEPTERQQYLSFVVRGGVFAVPIIKVKEILQYDGLTQVPGTPPSVSGVIDLRGSAVAVVDLGLKFGLGAATPTRLTCVLVVETDVEGRRALMGVLADSVREVMEVGADDVEQPPPFGPGVKVDWLLGMGKLEGRFALLLDIDSVLAADEHALAAAIHEAREAAGETPRPAEAAPSDGTATSSP